MLFNGNDLTGWRPATNWTVENTIIALKGRSDRQRMQETATFTERNFKWLQLEGDLVS